MEYYSVIKRNDQSSHENRGILKHILLSFKEASLKRLHRCFVVQIMDPLQKVKLWTVTEVARSLAMEGKDGRDE